ncbi:MAG: zinc ABC transporter substrate-binding protein [Hydrogenibacillus sp.]|nr:zinc ABC transporter substrate-binding protein [Hydrogenibacillus sp.]
MVPFRRRFGLFMVFLGATLASVGCGGTAGKAPGPGAGKGLPTAERPAEGQVIRAVATIFPIYDLVRQIGGDAVAVAQLVPPGAEPHAFEPSPSDIRKISDADVFFYVGAGFERWLDNVRDNIDADRTMLVDVSQGIDLLSGHAHDHGDEHGDGHAEDHARAATVDPHIWLSIANVKTIGQTIAKALSERDPGHGADFQANYDRLVQALDALDRDFREGLKEAKTKRFIVAHQAFGYLARDYGLEQRAISGLSPEAEPTPKEMIEIINEIKAENIRYIGFESLNESPVAKQIQRETGAIAVELSPIENVSKEAFADGIHYQDLLKRNFDTLLIMLEARPAP